MLTNLININSKVNGMFLGKICTGDLKYFDFWDNEKVVFALVDEFVVGVLLIGEWARKGLLDMTVIFNS